MHGEEVEGLGKSDLEEEDKDLKKRAQFHTARKEFKAYQQKKELKYWKTKKKNPVKAPNQQLKGFSNYVEGVEQVNEIGDEYIETVAKVKKAELEADKERWGEEFKSLTPDKKQQIKNQAERRSKSANRAQMASDYKTSTKQDQQVRNMKRVSD